MSLLALLLLSLGLLLALLLVLVTLPGTVELALLTLGALRTRAEPVPTMAPAPVALDEGPIAVLVPAHDEAAGIAATVASLQACADHPATGESPGFEVIVIADNCTDDTAERARAAGARVLAREDPERRGKGHALDFAFTALAAEPFMAWLVVDADSRVEPNLVAACRARLVAGAAAVQCNYRISNPEASLRARLLAIAWLAFNGLRLRGRAHWGLSVGILGNGFGLSRATLAAVPYRATSLVEDLEYHLRLVASGRRVMFVPETTVWTPAPLGQRAGTSQRARWEGGRLRMLLDWGPTLFKRVLAGEPRLTEPLLDLLLLPLAFHVALLALLLGLAPLLGSGWFGGYALLALALVVLHVLAAIRLGGGGWRDVAALTSAPFYILWKLTILRAIGRASRTDAAWVRTGRDSQADDDRGRPAR